MEEQIKSTWPRVATLLGEFTYENKSRNSWSSWDLGLPTSLKFDKNNCPKIITVGGGKGGVGKSLISANLASSLARLSKKVLLIDFDFGAANLQTYFGLNVPTIGLGDYLVNKNISLMDVAVETKINNLSLIMNSRKHANNFLYINNVFYKLWEDILNLRRGFDIDIVVFDLGAGSHFYNLDFFSSSHIGLVSALPEPTSIENAYVFLKAGMTSLLEKVGTKMGLSAATADAIDRLDLTEPTITSGGYLNVLKGIENLYPLLIDSYLNARKSHPIMVIMNQVRSQTDIQTAQSMNHICQSFFGFSTLAPTYLNHDDAAWKSLRNRRLLNEDFPHNTISKQIDKLAKSLLTVLDEV